MNTTSAIWLTTTVLLTDPSGQAQPQASQGCQPVASPQTVRMERVTFPSSTETLVGDLYLPTKPGPYPVLIITGAWRTVKEQMPAGYARQMAARGYAALVFDFRSWGQSTGRPRSMEDPMAKAQDIVAAARYLVLSKD
ncbi:alpha/beta hydrolase [Spirosoma foliorum]|uniref:Alpha/beta hydrolase n=1 Tax=Spirosoma foliorum TaxID=2710596 RepID=A0A7G5H1E3_9BACT|nr:CocE/NonD family hydrolase [Spirosoma foliorum]QMW04935.1 alpha/beta hydrolase [Spirosoma foliorum]